MKEKIPNNIEVGERIRQIRDETLNKLRKRFKNLKNDLFSK